jgi:hypothetical protein
MVEGRSTGCQNSRGGCVHGSGRSKNKPATALHFCVGSCGCVPVGKKPRGTSAANGGVRYVQIAAEDLDAATTKITDASGLVIRHRNAGKRQDITLLASNYAAAAESRDVTSSYNANGGKTVAKV